MKQEESQINLAKKDSTISQNDSKITQKDNKSFLFSPLDQLGLNYDQKKVEDVAELNKIVLQIINYPSTELAEMHTEAIKLGNFDLQQKTKTSSTKKIESQVKEVNTKCPCCGFTRQIDNIKICTSLDNIKNIGTSTYLYFNSLKHLSILLALMGLIYSIYAIATNLKANSVNSSTTALVDYITISLSPKQLKSNNSTNNFYYIQCWIGVAVIAIWAFVFAALKYFQVRGALQYDQDTNSISDFSVVIEGIPLDVTQEELQTQLNSYYASVTEYRKISEGRKRPFTIVRLNKGIPFYLNQGQIDSDELKTVQKELAELKETFLSWIQERKSRPAFSQSKQKREQTYNRYIQLLNKRAEIVIQLQKNIKKQLKQKKSDQLTTAFVTFQTNIAAKLMIELNQITFFSRIKGIFGDNNKFVLRRGQKLYNFQIRRAPEPEDIIWTNIGLNDCSFYGRKIFTYTVTLILLGACFAVVYALSSEQQKITANLATDSTSRYLSIVISLVIGLVNPILTVVIGFLTNFQRNYTMTNKQASLAIKSILAQMINSILIPVIVAKYIRNSIYETSGLVDNIFMMSITNALVGPALVFFDPINILNKFLRCIKSSSSSKLNQTQRDHNKFYLGVQFQVGSQYIYIANLFMFCCFFVSLQPINVFFALIGYLLMYWIQKYCMFYRYRRPVPSTDFVNQACSQIIMFGPLLYSLGSLTWSNFTPKQDIYSNFLLPNLIALGISIVILFLPLNTIVMGCCFSERVTKVAKYEEQRISFASQYDRMNPSTQEQAVAQYAKFCNDFSKNIQKLSAEKKKQIQQKIQINTQKAQLQQYQQQNSRPVNFGASYGLQSAHGAFTNIMAQNVYNSFVPPSQPAPIHVAPGYNQDNTQARIVQNQSIQYNAINMSVPQVQPYSNPMNMFGMNPMNAINPMGMMNPIGGMGFNPMMGMQQPFNMGFRW